MPKKFSRKQSLTRMILISIFRECFENISKTYWHWTDDNFQCYPLVQSIIIILYWMFIKYIVYITPDFKTIQVKWIFVFAYRILYSNAQMTPVRIYGELYALKFCEVDNFWNINRRQAISLVAKSHHVLGRNINICICVCNILWSKNKRKGKDVFSSLRV